MVVLVAEFELDKTKIIPEAMPCDDLGLDSLDAVDMVVVLEKRLNIRLHDEKTLRSLRTVSDLLDFLNSLQNR